MVTNVWDFRFINSMNPFASHSSAYANTFLHQTDIDCPKCGHKLMANAIPPPGRFFCSNCGYSKDIGDDNGNKPSPLAMRY